VVQLLCKARGLTPEPFIRTPVVQWAEEARLAARIMRVAAFHGALRAREAIRDLRAAHRVASDDSGKPLDPTDPTREIDRAAWEAIDSVLAEANRLPPFSKGYLLIREEGPPRKVTGKAGSQPSPWVFFVDEVDNTAGALRDMGGMVCVSGYVLGVGWLFAVAVDVSRWYLYSRVQGEATQVLRLLAKDNSESPLGRERPITFDQPFGTVAENLAPKPTQTAKNLAVCLNLMHPDRLALTLERCRPLLVKEVIEEILSVGGSLGPILVGEGHAEVSIEVKGYRPIDFAPGVLLAQGLGAAVVDLTGRPLRLDLPDRDLEAILALRSAQEIGSALKDFRKTFVVAATAELAAGIVGQIARPGEPAKSAPSAA
jgi:fructose-1,6-bisphosphatase/inositol monophosphatase family enzyme